MRFTTLVAILSGRQRLSFSWLTRDGFAYRTADGFIYQPKDS